jgi:hypothetical protein
MSISLLDNTKGFADAWRRVSQVAAECDISAVADSFALGHIDGFVNYFYIPEGVIPKTTTGKKYSDLYTSRQLEDLERVLGPSFDSSMSADDMPPMKLWNQFLTCRSYSRRFNKNLTVENIKKEAMEAMDLALAVRSKTDGKRYFGFETDEEIHAVSPKFQSMLYTSFTIEEQAEILYREVKYQTAHPKRGNDDLLMEKYYKERNFFAMEKADANRWEYIDSLGLSDSLARKLRECEREAGRIVVENRTRNWMGRILSEIQSAPTLIDVGAAHLLGKEGLINLLRENGYTVEPVMQE